VCSPPATAPPAGNRNAYATIQAESFDAQSGVQTEATTDAGGGQDVGFVANGDFMRYNRVDFGATPARQFMARVASGAGAGITVGAAPGSRAATGSRMARTAET